MYMKILLINKLRMEKNPINTVESQNYKNNVIHNGTTETFKKDLSKNLSEWKKWDKERIEIMLETGEWWVIVENLDKFEWKDHMEIARNLIKTWRWWFVVSNLEKFELIDYMEIVKRLIKAWEWWTVAKNLEKFKWIDRKQVEEELKKQWYWDIVVKYSKNFD